MQKAGRIALAIVVLLAASLQASSRTSPEVERNLRAGPVVRTSPAAVLTAQARGFLAERTTPQVNVWVFFTDKQVFTQADFDRAAAEVEMSDKVISRRSRTGLDRVVFADLAVSPQYVADIEALGAKHRRSSRWLNAASFAVDFTQLDALAALPYVSEIRPVAASHRIEPEQPSEDAVQPREQQVEDLNYGNSYNQLEQIGVTQVHKKGYHGQGVILGVLDTGFRKDHEAFAQHYLDGRVLDEYDFINDDSNTANEGGQDLSSQWDHGTYTWSTSGGGKDGSMYGPAYQASFLLAKTEDIASETPIEEDNWVAALEWASMRGVDVITSSLSYFDWYTTEDFDGQTAVTSIAASMALSMGIVVCNSAGNSGPAPQTLGAPADAFDILTVGAVNNSGFIASFSSHGPTADGRTKPEVCARGVTTYCAASTTTTSYTTKNGTSLSTPLVAGAATVLIGARPTYPPALVREALMMTASQWWMPDNTYGWGIIDLRKAIDYGVNFTADSLIGVAPLTVNFTDSNTFSPLSWNWEFGDDSAATVPNPSHTYTAPGEYTVSLAIGTAEYGDITNEKPAYIRVIEDSLIFVPDSAYAGQSLLMSVELVNSLELDQVTVPFSFPDVPFPIVIDSVTRGTRTELVPDLEVLEENAAENKYAYRLNMQSGMGWPTLSPGSGEVLRIYLTIDSLATGGESVTVSGPHDAFTAALLGDVLTYDAVTVAGDVSTQWIYRGDVDHSQSPIIDSSDLGALVAFLFGEEFVPLTIQSGDWNADGTIDSTDLGLIVAYFFSEGDPPVNP